jgi:mannose-6-phosphate isomerase-like protein (cupin superfamily)
LVLGGQLTIQMRDRDVVLGPRELFVVPRGVEYCPVGAENLCHQAIFMNHAAGAVTPPDAEAV